MDFKEKSASRYIITSLAVLLIFTSFLLVALNAWQLQSKPPFVAARKTSTQGYIEGYQAARKTYQTLCPLATSVKQFTGTVQKNDGTTLAVLQLSLDADPLVDGVGNIRTVTIDANTKIQRVIQKTPELFQKDLDAYAKKQSGTPPVPVQRVDIPLSDIKTGQTITVESTVELRLLQTIPASSISVIGS